MENEIPLLKDKIVCILDFGNSLVVAFVRFKILLNKLMRVQNFITKQSGDPTTAKGIHE